MDQTTTQQPQGNFYVSVNKRKRQGDNLPAFQGNIQIPGTSKTFNVVLWANEYADPTTSEMKKVFNGNTSLVARNADADEQLSQLVAAGNPGAAVTENNLSVDPTKVVLFENKFREESIAKAKAEGKDINPPHYWGRWNPGNGERMVALSVWQTISKQRYSYGEVVLTGFSQYPQPGQARASVDARASSESEHPAPTEEHAASRRRGGRRSEGLQQQASIADDEHGR